MFRILGAVLIGGCTAYMGMSLAAVMQQRLKSVIAYRDSLLRMHQKVSFYRLPLPTLLRELSTEQADITSAFYAKAAGRMEQNQNKTAERILCECMQEEENMGLPVAAQQCAIRLWRMLGRLDDANQDEIMLRTIRELDEIEGSMREDLKRQTRCSCALGLCGGLALTILLV